MLGLFFFGSVFVNLGRSFRSLGWSRWSLGQLHFFFVGFRGRSESSFVLLYTQLWFTFIWVAICLNIQFSCVPMASSGDQGSRDLQIVQIAISLLSNSLPIDSDELTSTQWIASHVKRILVTIKSQVSRYLQLHSKLESFHMSCLPWRL